MKRPALLRTARVLCIAGTVLTGTVAAGDTLSPIGANFWFFWDNQASWPFVDFFKQSRTFWSSSSSQWDDGRQLTLDSLGYPTSLLAGQSAATLVFWDQLGTHPAGQFVLLYDGDGDITIDFGSVSTVSSTPGRIVVNVQDSTTGLRIRITRTNPANHVRNIRFIAPGFEQTYQTQIFHPLFLSRLHSMKVLRFMDWLNTNRSVIQDFSDYTPVHYQTQGGERGVSPTHLIQLCNRLGCDMWWNMPHQATDACIRSTLELLRDSLDPCRRIYLEWSNEVWNGMFDSHGYCRTMGEQLGLGTGWGATIAYWSMRLSQMMVIAEDVFAGQMNRLVRVYGTQVGNTGVLSGLLGSYNGTQHCDAVAVAPYFGGSGSSVDAVLASAQTAASQVGSVIAGDKTIADQHGFDVIAYESGLDIFGLSSTLQEQVRWDPRMKDIWKTYWSAWRAGGGKLIVQYTFCDPVWGILHHQSQDTTQAPGYMAAQEWIAANPRWWTDPPIGCGIGIRPSVAPHSPPALSATLLRQGGEVFVRLTQQTAGARWAPQVVDLTGRGLTVRLVETTDCGDATLWRVSTEHGGRVSPQGVVVRVPGGSVPARLWLPAGR
jgi:hypothetical protein